VIVIAPVMRRFPPPTRVRFARRDSTRFHAMTSAGTTPNPRALTARDGPGTQDDFAAAVTYPLSDDARFITGTRLYVDGGGLPYA
jgi:meso-butanediol dehydrogenase / (S,S)-butanediol dehydrogenase / diacetyl reductase